MYMQNDLEKILLFIVHIRHLASVLFAVIANKINILIN